MMEKSKCPTVLCPKENKDVPVYHCLGSFIQQKPTCPHVIRVDLNFPQKEGTVTCEKVTLPLNIKFNDGTLVL